MTTPLSPRTTRSRDRWTLTPTAVKHNMGNNQTKRAQHRIWPQHTMPPL